MTYNACHGSHSEVDLDAYTASEQQWQAGPGQQMRADTGCQAAAAAAQQHIGPLAGVAGT